VNGVAKNPLDVRSFHVHRPHPNGSGTLVRRLTTARSRRDGMELSRRYFFLLTAGTVLQPGAERVDRDMLVRSARPEDLEMHLSGFSDYITPIERREHSVDPLSWSCPRRGGSRPNEGTSCGWQSDLVV
jgi:hypothetical protein